MPLATALLPGFDLPSTMALQQLGRADPTARLAENRFLKVFATGEGAMFYYFEARGDAVHLAVGPEGALPSPALVAAAAAPVELPPEIRSAPALRRVAAAFPGLRVLPVPWMFDVAAGAILQQRVTFAEAAAGFARIATRYGTPGPYGLQLFPTAERLARLPGYAFQELGIDPQRGRALQRLAYEESQRPFLATTGDLGELRRRLLALPGIGPWTAEMIAGFGAGDSDALPLGDVHLPHLVARVFEGRPSGSDARMTELLEPFRPHRFFVVRLLWSAVFHAPPHPCSPFPHRLRRFRADEHLLPRQPR